MAVPDVRRIGVGTAIGLTFHGEPRCGRAGVVMAVTLLAMLPILLVFIAFAAAKMIKGLTSGAVRDRHGPAEPLQTISRAAAAAASVTAGCAGDGRQFR